MERLERKTQGGQTVGMAALALCASFALLGAAAGCFSGSFVEAAALWSESGRGFGEYPALNLLAVGIVLVLGFSAPGVFLLPLLSGAAGFVAGFVSAAVLAGTGSWKIMFLRCGWVAAAGLPAFTALCAGAMGMSAAVMRALFIGMRSQRKQIADLLKVLMISVLTAILPAIVAAAA